MTLPASPNPISLSEINVELGHAANAQINLNQADVRALANVATGPIRLPEDFWGKSSGPPPTMRLLIIGGAGGQYNDGGGGAGGMLEIAAEPIARGTVRQITIGAGGAAGAKGSDSSYGTHVGVGGGRGGMAGDANANGGSGGGAYASGGFGGYGTSGQGTAGGYGYKPGSQPGPIGAGGGGGAGVKGGNGNNPGPGEGGAGKSSNISGSTRWFAGGGPGLPRGDGSVSLYPTGETAGAHRTAGASDTGAGTANTGSGGINSGGSGIVIARIATSAYSGAHTGNPIVTVVGTDTVLEWHNDGSYTE